MLQGALTSTGEISQAQSVIEVGLNPSVGEMLPIYNKINHETFIGLFHFKVTQSNKSRTISNAEHLCRSEATCVRY